GLLEATADACGAGGSWFHVELAAGGVVASGGVVEEEHWDEESGKGDTWNLITAPDR
ncbi:unnamed protein product, partial [Durusdinium trenchii]